MTRWPTLGIAAIVAAVFAGLAAAWLALGMPGASFGQGGVSRAATGQGLFPFTLGVAALAVVVAMASGTVAAQRRRGAAGLWMILAGIVLMLVSTGIGFHLSPSNGEAVRYEDIAPGVGLTGVYWFAGFASLILMLVGVVLWLSARWRRRG